MLFLNKSFLDDEIKSNEIKLKDLIAFIKSDSFFKKITDPILRNTLSSQIDLIRINLKLFESLKELISEEYLEHLNIKNIKVLIALWDAGDYLTMEELTFKWFDLGNLNSRDINFFITYCNRHLRIIDDNNNYLNYNKQQKVLDNISEVLL